ncbi:hypothetical protein ES702_01771 [subsurface metagenome]
MSQKGIPNAISMAAGAFDIHSFFKRDSIAPTKNYTGIIEHAEIGVDPVVTDIIYLTPLVIPKGMLINMWAYRVTVLAAGENLRVGLYANEPATLMPTTLLKDWGEFSLGATGTFYTGVLDYFLPGKRIYWLATWVSGGAAWFANLTPADRHGLVGYDSAGEIEIYPSIGFKFTKIYDGIFPDPWPDYAAGMRGLPSNEKTPGIFFRFHNF